jgi:hypothetical protein
VSLALSLRSFTDAGIGSLGALHAALKLAMQLEFATIPPYLCAQWSIRNDPDRVEQTLHSIVGQEMQHLALAGNLLTAVGGRPQLATAGFIPAYPVRNLPGNVLLSRDLDLRPCDRAQVELFMEIEEPEFPPEGLVAGRPPTIGSFYDTIIQAFETLRPAIDPTALCIEVPLHPLIRTVDDALAVMEIIKQEGEGLRGLPEQPLSEREAYAHYYQFKEVACGRRLIRVNGQWAFEGEAVRLPEVYSFTADTSGRAALPFRRILRDLLGELEACWIVGRPFDVAAMFRLELEGRALVRAGIRPEFTWIDVET